MYLTKRQQQVLRFLQREGYGLPSGDGTGRWCPGSVPIDGESAHCAASTLYALLDLALLALGSRYTGDIVCELTECGEELAELLTATLTKRQQQVLKSLLQIDVFSQSTFGNGYWVDPCGAACDIWVAPSTIYFLVDAELVGLGVSPGTLDHIVALTPRGRRLAELLSRS